MIHRDEEGNAIGVDKLSDISKAMADIEKDLKKVKKNGVENYSEEDKKELLKKVNDFKALLTFAKQEVDKSKNPVEILGLIKQIIKFKDIAEEFQKLVETSGNDKINDCDDNKDSLQ